MRKRLNMKRLAMLAVVLMVEMILGCTKDIVNLSDNISVTGIKVSTELINLNVGEKATIGVTISPENANDKSVNWKSSDTSIVTVSNGLIQGISEGSATITVTTNDSKISKNIIVNVTKVVVNTTITASGISVDKPIVQIKVGENITIKATVTPDNATDKNIKWVSGDSTIATVNNGIITAIKEGKTTVTVSTTNGGISKVLDVTVGPKQGTTTNPSITTGSGVNNQYTLEQAMSDNAQLSTIAFSGLAFITGSSGADTFMPPGKVADFFGFQYMRDIDVAGYGHNTQFLTRAASNVLYILNTEQKAKLVALSKEQAPLYVNFAYNRFPLMNAFRRALEGKEPTTGTSLSIESASQYTANLYITDAELSYNRAVVVGEIINSFSDEQKAYLAKMEFNNFLTWPDVAEDDTLKKSMDNNQFVAVMTYASELFSWYKGSLTADVYFCPERHGTYFGGFFMKDYPAMNNPDYFISTAITGDSGQEFLKILNTEQRALVTGIIDAQRNALKEIAEIRTTVSTELRKAISGGTIDKEKVYTLIKRYGALDGEMSGIYASRFAAVNKTLTTEQRSALIKLRNLDVVPQGAYRFSTPIPMPEIPNNDYLFGIGSIPDNAGQLTAPDSFSVTNQPPKP